MKHYYISNPEAEKGFEEITEAEWLALIGNDTTRPYANQSEGGI